MFPGQVQLMEGAKQVIPSRIWPQVFDDSLMDLGKPAYVFEWAASRIVEVGSCLPDREVSGSGFGMAVACGEGANEEIKAIVVNPVQPDTVYAGSFASGVYASTNGGASWTLINAGLRNRSIRALTISADGSVLYAGTFGEGVFRLGDVPAAAVSSRAR